MVTKTTLTHFPFTWELSIRKNIPSNFWLMCALYFRFVDKFHTALGEIGSDEMQLAT